MKSFLSVVLVLGSILVAFCEQPEECLLGKHIPHPAFCFNTNPTWTYDHFTKECVEIPKYGCPGYKNVFETEQECISTCVMGEAKSSIDLISGNILDKEPRLVNEIVDQVLSLVSGLIKKIGQDPVSLPDLTTDTIPNLELGLKNGSLSGFSNIVREGDWDFSMDGLTKYKVHGGVAVSDITIKYILLAKLFGIGGEAGVKASVDTLGIEFNFFLDVLACSLGMEDFTLGEVAEINIDIDAVSFLDPVLESVTEYLSNSLLDLLTSTIEGVINETLGSINVCEMIVPLIG